MPSDYARAQAVLAMVRPVPDLVPLFPAASYTPSAPCPHRGRIPRGSVLVCVQCYQSGQDHRYHIMPGLIQVDRETGLPPRPEYDLVAEQAVRAEAQRKVYRPPPGGLRGGIG